MALSHKAWVAVGHAARLLMAGFLAAFAWLKHANHVGGDGAGGSPYDLQSYAYAVLAAARAVLLQTPVAAYLLCRAGRGGRPSSAAALDASMYADMAATAALASGVGAGFGATGDARRMVDNLIRWERGGDYMKRYLDAYYARGAAALVCLLAGMILSMCASVVSARVRARAGGEGHILGN